MVMGLDVFLEPGVVLGHDLGEMAGRLVEADVELARLGNGHAADPAGNQQHGLGAVVLRRPQGDLHLRDAVGQGRLALVELPPAEEHGVNPHPLIFGHLPGGGGFPGQRLPLRGFHALEAGGLPGGENLFARHADQGLVQGGLPRCGAQPAGEGKSDARRGGGGEKCAAFHGGSLGNRVWRDKIGVGTRLHHIRMQGLKQASAEGVGRVGQVKRCPTIIYSQCRRLTAAGIWSITTFLPAAVSRRLMVHKIVKLTVNEQTPLTPR